MLSFPLTIDLNKVSTVHFGVLCLYLERQRPPSRSSTIGSPWLVLKEDESFHEQEEPVKFVRFPTPVFHG